MTKSLLLTLSGLWALAHSGVQALEPTIQKIHPPVPAAGQTPAFGKSVAASDRFILVGDTGDDSLGTNAGAVYVHDAKTGKRLRKLTAGDGAAEDAFGTAVAVSGNVGIVGAPGADGDRGAVYVFDVAKGTAIRKLLGTNSAVEVDSPDAFGHSVALDGITALIGAPGDDLSNEDRDCGSAYAMNVLTGVLIKKFVLSADDTAAENGFGTSVAISGNVAAVGEPGATARTQAGAGRVHIFDIQAGTRIRSLTPLDAGAGDAFGSSLAIYGPLILAGAPKDENPGFENSGSAYLINFVLATVVHKFLAQPESFDEEVGTSVALSGTLALVGGPGKVERGVRSGGAYLFDPVGGTILSRLNVQAGFQNALYGSSVALAGNVAVIASPGDDDVRTDAGAVYLFKNLSGPVGVATLAKKGDYAPGAAEIDHAGFSAYQITNPGSNPQVLLQGTLTGAGSSGGRTQGLWSRLFGTLDLSVQLGDAVGLEANAPKIAAITQPVHTRTGLVTYYAKVKGAGVTAKNDERLMVDNGFSVTPILVEGQSRAGISTQGVISGLGQMVNASSAELAALIVGLATSPQQVVTKTNDSAALILSLPSGFTAASLVEGQPSPITGVNYGQIGPRITLAHTRALVPVALVSGATTVTPANNAGLVFFGNNVPDQMLARRGEAPPDTTGFFKDFLGECVSGNGASLFRATLTGVPASENEGLWGGRGQMRLVAQKGKPVPGLEPGVHFASFLRYWCTNEGFVILAKVAGTGVIAANDVVLLHRTSNLSLTRLLMREGDLAPDCSAARIGLIQKVEVDRVSGAYAIIATLTGSDAASSQTLWTGQIQEPNIFLVTPAELTKPRLRLRRGSFQSLGSTTAALTTIDFFIPTDPTGAGARGLGGPVASNIAALVLTFANKQVIAGPLVEPQGSMAAEVEPEEIP